VDSGISTSSLKSNHAHSGQKRYHHDEHRWHETSLGGRCSPEASTSRRAGATARATRWCRCHSARACSAGLVDKRLAGPTGAGGLLGLGSTFEAASIGCAALGFVVCVEYETELLAWAAHAVCTIVAEGGVVGDAIASLRVVTANVVEKLTIVVRVRAWIDHAAKSISHALAELRIWSWWKRSSSSSPAITSRARSGRVGWGVAVHLSASRVNLGELRLQIGEVLESRDGVAADRNEACPTLVWIMSKCCFSKKTHTVIIGFLEIHIDNTSRPHVLHLRSVER
jgi:hypothetical protein